MSNSLKSLFRTIGVLCLCLAGFFAQGCKPEAPPAPSSPATPTAPSRPESPAAPAAPSGEAKPAQSEPGKKLVATLVTNKGTIEFELLTDDAPKACDNFRLLANRGYYNNLTFHRVINGFMIQGGDPNGNGTGGQSAWGGTFDDEINPGSPLYQGGYKPGIVAMANRGPNTNGSQFFIMHKNYPLPPRYTIFGRVTKGQNVVDSIATAPAGPNDMPLSKVIITSAKVVEMGG